MQGEDEKRNESGVLVTVTETPTEGTSPPVDPALDPMFLALCKRVADEGGCAEYRLGGGDHFPEPLGVALSDEEAAALQRFNATLEPGARFFLVPGPPVSAPRLVSELPAPVEDTSPPTVGQSPTVEPGAFVHLSPRIEGRDPVVELEIRRLKQRIRHQRRELRALHRHGEPGCSYCWPPCLRAPWTCPGEDDDDEGEPTEGARAAPPSLTFRLEGS